LIPSPDLRGPAEFEVRSRMNKGPVSRSLVRYEACVRLPGARANTATFPVDEADAVPVRDANSYGAHELARDWLERQVLDFLRTRPELLRAQWREAGIITAFDASGPSNSDSLVLRVRAGANRKPEFEWT
jgi:hypothetical protein